MSRSLYKRKGNIDKNFDLKRRKGNGGEKYYS